MKARPLRSKSIHEAWALGLNECPFLSSVAITRLRTFNGASLIERCHRAWRNQSAIHLEYRDMDGLNTAPILAARSLDVEEGQLLVLWVRVESDEEEESNDLFDNSGAGEDDPDFPEM